MRSLSCTWPYLPEIEDDFEWLKKLRSLQLDPKVISFNSFYYNKDVILEAIANIEDWSEQQDRDRRELEAKTIEQERREAERLEQERLGQERLEVERAEKERLEQERAEKACLEAEWREAENLKMKEAQREFESNEELRESITKSEPVFHYLNSQGCIPGHYLWNMKKIKDTLNSLMEAEACESWDDVVSSCERRWDEEKDRPLLPS